MRRSHRIAMATTALLGVFAGFPSVVRAQGPSAGIGGVPRTSNERVVTETPTPPPVNSDARRAAEGQLVPVVPPGTAAVAPAQVPVPTVPDGARAIDPAARLVPAVPAVPVVGRLAVYPAGMETALLAEHALGMAIEGSALRTIAERANPGPGGNESARMLLGHADRLMAESQALLGKAVSDAPAVAANAPIRRFHRAAIDYTSTLATLGAASKTDRAQMALINHAVKEVLDADHISQMGRGASAGPAMNQLLNHARNMRNEGTQTILRLAGNGTVDPNVATGTQTLARRGREVIDAAGELNAVLAAQAGTVPVGTVPLPVGPNPGRFQDNRPEIIGGTFGTSNPTTGTYTGKGDPLNPGGLPKINNEGAPIPSPRDRTNTTGSNGGLPPR